MGILLNSEMPLPFLIFCLHCHRAPFTVASLSSLIILYVDPEHFQSSKTDPKGNVWY